MLTADDARRTMRDAIKDAAYPVMAGEPLKVWMARVARDVGIALGRLYDIYTGEAVPRWHEGQTIINRAQERREQIARFHDYQRRNRIAALETANERIKRDGTAQVERRAHFGGPPSLDCGEASAEQRSLFELVEASTDLDRE